MNTYSVSFMVDHCARRFYDVDASSHGAAINRALKNLIPHRAKYLSVSSACIHRDIKRHYSDPKVRPM